MNNDTVLGLQPGKSTSRPAPIGSDGNTESSLESTLADLITTYHELNPSTIDELYEEPSPLEFMRFVARNRPFVVRRGAETWAARKKWNAQYLGEVMKDSEVNVAMTPHGNADSVIDHESGNLLFVKPYEIKDSFQSVIEKIQQQELDPESFRRSRWPTRYAQTQNDNLRNEYAALFEDVPKDIPFARVTLEKSPDAINFWLGNSHSTTALHKDNYENIYVQVLGKKHFVLLPPVESACVNEQAVLAATYSKQDGPPELAPEFLAALPPHIAEEVHQGEARERHTNPTNMVVQVDDPEEYVPFATWDPDHPLTRPTPFSKYSQPLRVTLEEGDMLYLPALWYHKVSQSCSPEGICCAVNYWYDLDFSGSFWPLCTFSRGVGLVSTRAMQS